MKGEYEEFHALRRRKNEPNLFRIEYSVRSPKDCVMRIAKWNLKKRTQYEPALIGTTSYVKGDYGNIPAGGIEENEPNQSQFQNPTNAPKERQEIRISETFRDLGCRKA